MKGQSILDLVIMKVRRIPDLVFPYVEKLSHDEENKKQESFKRDLNDIGAADWTKNAERALDEAQKISAKENERVRTAESKATTYLAVLAALVPVITAIQAANWEKKAGPAPDAARLFVLGFATIYVAAAGFHAFKALKVTGFQRLGEKEIATAWQDDNPLAELTRATLQATRNSRDAVNDKITQIRLTHEHLLRAFGAFVLLLLLDPFFYALAWCKAPPDPPPARVVVIGPEDLTLLPMVRPASLHRVPSFRRPEFPLSAWPATRDGGPAAAADGWSDNAPQAGLPR